MKYYRISSNKHQVSNEFRVSSTGFYMISASVMKGLKRLPHNSKYRAY